MTRHSDLRTPAVDACGRRALGRREPGVPGPGRSAWVVAEGTPGPLRLPRSLLLWPLGLSSPRRRWLI